MSEIITEYDKNEIKTIKTNKKPKIRLVGEKSGKQYKNKAK